MVMLVYNVHDMSWKKVSEQTMSADLFSEEVINEWLIHEYVVMYLANQRQATAHTKTRSEVQRSWKKLYRQKWTGNARVWDAWSPIRRKWWVVFGPRNERNYSKQMNTKMRRKAMKWAIALKAKSDQLLGLDVYASDEVKTKNVVNMLDWMKMKWQKLLVVLPEGHDVMEKSMRNVAKLWYTTTAKLNPYDLMAYKNILFVWDAFAKLEERLSA